MGSADMIRDSLWFLLRYSGVLCLFFLVLPLLGALVLYKGLQKVHVPNVTYRQCARAYLCASSSAFCLLLLVDYLRGFFMGEGARLPAMPFIQLAVAAGAQLLLIPLILKKYSSRALLVEGLAILLTLALAAGLGWLLLNT